MRADREGFYMTRRRLFYADLDKEEGHIDERRIVLHITFGNVLSTGSNFF